MDKWTEGERGREGAEKNLSIVWDSGRAVWHVLGQVWDDINLG